MRLRWSHAIIWACVAGLSIGIVGSFLDAGTAVPVAGMIAWWCSSWAWITSSVAAKRDAQHALASLETRDGH